MECGNWRRIILLPAKVLGKVIITRIRNTVDTRFRQQQTWFRRGKGTIEQIFILRNIIEQVIEWNANLYVCFFVDFEKALDRYMYFIGFERYFMGNNGRVWYSIKVDYNGNGNA